MQGIEQLATHLEAVFQIVKRRFDQLCARFTDPAVLNVTAAQFRGAKQHGWQDHVAFELQLRGCLLARSRSGMPRDENQFINSWTREIDLQVIRCTGRFAVLIGAQHRKIESPTRKLKIVWVTAERRNIRLRCEYQSHVVVALILVNEVLTALIERDRLTLEWTGLRFTEIGRAHV